MLRYTLPPQDCIKAQLPPYRMAYVFSTERSRLGNIEAFCIDHLKIIPNLRVDLSRSFFEDSVGRLPGTPLDVLIQFEKTLPAGENIFNSTCQCSVLRAVDLQIAEIDDKPLAGISVRTLSTR